MESTRSVPLALLASLFAFPACSGSGGGASARPAVNLQVAAFRIDHAVPTAGHEVRAFTSIRSDAEVDDVVVGFYLLNEEDHRAKKDDIRQFLVDTAHYEGIRPGTQEYETVVVLPAEMPFDGGPNSQDDWLLIAEVDPADAVPETDEEDNRSPDSATVGMHNRNTPQADIVIEDVTASEDAIILHQDDARPPITTPTGQIADERNHDFGVTLEITTTGAHEVKDCDISATIMVPGHASQEIRFWDSDTETYQDELLTTIRPGIPNTVHADLWFPGGTRRIVGDHLRTGPASNRLTVTFSSNMTAGISEWEMGVQRLARQDNRFEVPVVIILPPGAGNGIDWTSRFAKDWTNRYFGIGLDLGAATSLDARGAIAQGWGRIPVKLFGIASDALDALAYGRVKPVEGPNDESEFRLNVDVFGVNLVNVESINQTYTESETYVQSKTYRRDGVVFAGPVPIQLTAKATGSYGIETTVFVNPAGFVQVDVVPFAQATALASASVNVVVARFGVEGTMTLIDDRLVTRGSVDISSITSTTYTGTSNLSVYNVLTGPSGRLYLFAERKVVKLCHGFIPCGLRTKRNERTLARFRSFEKTDVLFNDTRTATVAY